MDLCSDRHNQSGMSIAVPISLDAVLPPSSGESAKPVEIPFVQDCNWSQSFANIEWSLSPSLPEGMQVHRSTAIEFLCGGPMVVVLQFRFAMSCTLMGLLLLSIVHGRWFTCTGLLMALVNL